MSDTEITMLTLKDQKRLLEICKGNMFPETSREVCCYNAYTMRIQGAPMDYCLNNMEPDIAHMDIHEIRHFLAGIAFAEQEIIKFGGDLDIEDDSETKEYH